jgi:hypothetical protein
MVKQTLVLASTVVAMLACQKEEETDFERGKKDGTACCACMETAATEEQKSRCALQYLDLNKFAELTAASQLNDYAAGVLTAPCIWNELMNMGRDDLDDSYDFSLEE